MMSFCRGYYPRGGGEIHLTTIPAPFLKAVQLTARGEITQVEGRAFVAGALPVKVQYEIMYAAVQVHRCLSERLLRGWHDQLLGY